MTDEDRLSMTERTSAPPYGRRRHREAPGRPRRRPPGLRAAATLALVLGVAAAVSWAARYPDPAIDVGTPAAMSGPAAGEVHDADRAARDRGDRSGRGQPRPVPRSAPATPARGKPAGTTTAAPAGNAPAARPVGPISAPPRSSRPAPATTTARPAPRPTTPATTAATTVTGEVVRLTNAERAKAGCPALRVDPKLTVAAQGHSVDMASRGYFSHTSPEGETPWDRAEAAGYQNPSAENIAMGYRTAADVVSGWMNSEGHRTNILNCSSRAVGIGLDTRGYYWTQLFGYV